MARPRNQHPSVSITITATPKLVHYLEDIVQEEGYGATPSEIARNLVWRGIEELIAKGIITQRRGPADRIQGRKKKGTRRSK
jgi:hypothetical protein